MNKKILIIHDRFQYRGGGERLVLIMAKGLNADILTEYWDEKNSFAKTEFSGKVFTLGKQFKVRGIGYVSAQLRFFFKTKIIKNYDIIIFSGNNCLSAAWRARGKRKIMYCHTPVRYAYDLKNYYYKKYPFYLKPVFLFFVYLARVIYQWGIKKMDKIMANSKNVQNRLKYYCHMESAVVYPPIDTEKFKWLGQKDYYLSFARLVDLKRVDDVVRAFQKMTDKKLVIASGGPEFDKIKKICYHYKNINILGFVSDETLAKLVGNCIANIYIPKQEDFGMTPLEAASAGKPTIGVDDGGLKETIIHRRTGYLIPKDYEIKDLVEAVEWLGKDKALDMKIICAERAKKFSNANFIDLMKQCIINIIN